MNYFVAVLFFVDNCLIIWNGPNKIEYKGINRLQLTLQFNLRWWYMEPRRFSDWEAWVMSLDFLSVWLVKAYRWWITTHVFLNYYSIFQLYCVALRVICQLSFLRKSESGRGLFVGIVLLATSQHWQWVVTWTSWIQVCTECSLNIMLIIIIRCIMLRNLLLSHVYQSWN